MPFTYYIKDTAVMPFTRSPETGAGCGGKKNKWVNYTKTRQNPAKVGVEVVWILVMHHFRFKTF